MHIDAESLKYVYLHPYSSSCIEHQMASVGRKLQRHLGAYLFLHVGSPALLSDFSVELTVTCRRVQCCIAIETGTFFCCQQFTFNLQLNFSLFAISRIGFGP